MQSMRPLPRPRSEPDLQSDALPTELSRLVVPLESTGEATGSRATEVHRLNF